MANPERVLLISSRLTPEREHALRRTFRLNDGVDALATGQPLADLRVYRAIILDGPQEGLPPEAVPPLAEFVRAGGSLVALGAAPAVSSDEGLAALLGAVAGPPLPAGELFGLAAAPQHPLLRRVEPEFPLVDVFRELTPLNGESRILLNVNWAWRDRPALLERPLGAGRVVVSSLGNTSEALLAPALGTVLRRALQPRADGTEERALGVAIVGYGPQGGMGFVHGTAVEATPGLALVAVCDRAVDRQEAARIDFPQLRAHDSLDSLAKDPGVDIVIVATPPASHREIALQMLQQGKHVVCEKPMCFTAEEADLLIATARKNDVVLAVNQNRRWDGDFLAIRRALDAGRLGELFNVETFVGDFAHPCRYWHSDEEVSGGAIFDWGAHFIDWTLQLLPGTPASVSAMAHKRVWHDVTNADQVRVRMLWHDGKEAEFLYSDVAAVRKPKFYLQGTAGTLVGHYRPVAFERIEPAIGYVREEAHFAEAPADLVLARYESGYAITETRLPPVPQPPFALHRNLADHLHLGEPLAVTPESVRAVIAVLETAQRSAQQGSAPLSIPTQ